MDSIRYKQQKIIAYKLFLMRTKISTEDEPNPWEGHGDTDGDFIWAGKILDHFEDDIKTVEWYRNEEDYVGFREVLTEDYLAYCTKVEDTRSD
jgi:hypothetical protein